MDNTRVACRFDSLLSDHGHASGDIEGVVTESPELPEYFSFGRTDYHAGIHDDCVGVSRIINKSALLVFQDFPQFQSVSHVVGASKCPDVDSLFPDTSDQVRSGMTVFSILMHTPAP